MRGRSAVTTEDLAPYLRPTYFIDSDEPSVRSFAEETTAGATTDVERAKRLFLAVRDRIRYNPYISDSRPEHFKASAALTSQVSFCVPKAVLLAAALRALGIPSRLGFADVTNHLATERLLKLIGTNVFVLHGYTQVYLNGRWLKATPTFNAALCEKFGVAPLVFDGEHDAIFHEFTSHGDRHMEYVRDRGHYADLPLEELFRIWRETYPMLFAPGFRPDRSGDDFEAEAEAERRILKKT